MHSHFPTHKIMYVFILSSGKTVLTVKISVGSDLVAVESWNFSVKRGAHGKSDVMSMINYVGEWL